MRLSLLIVCCHSALRLRLRLRTNDRRRFMTNESVILRLSRCNTPIEYDTPIVVGIDCK
jgi:hypothetical protein